MKTLYRGRWVVGYDEEQESHVIYDDGELVLEDDRVVFAGKAYDGEVDRIVDASSCLISPGFINSHGFMDVSIYQYSFDQPPEGGYFRPRSWVEEPEQSEVFTPREVRLGAELSFLNHVKSGCTTVCGITSMVFKRWDDPEWEPQIYLESAVKLGPRLYLSHHYRARAPYTDGNGKRAFVLDEKRGMEGLSRCIELIRNYRGSFGGKIQGLLFPYTLDQSSTDLLLATAEAAEELDVRVRMHTAQSEEEMEFIHSEYGASPIEYLESLDVLSPRWLLTHCLHIGGNHPLSSEDDLQVLADRGVSVANCPWIYTFRGGYLNSFSRYRRAGINMLLGTDTFPQDMLREMRWGSIMSKVAEQSSTSGRAEEIFDAVTVNAARYLGRDDLGKLSPGAKADVVMVDFDRFSIGPTEDPIRSLVYFATAADIRRVLVDGENVVDDFKSTRVDEGEVVRNSQGVSNHVRDTLCRWMGKDSPQDEFPPPAYPRVR